MDPDTKRRLLAKAGFDSGKINWYADRISEGRRKLDEAQLPATPEGASRRVVGGNNFASDTAEANLRAIGARQGENARARRAIGDTDAQRASAARLLQDQIAAVEDKIAQLRAAGADPYQIADLQKQVTADKTLLKELTVYQPRRDIGELPDAKGAFVDGTRKDLKTRAAARDSEEVVIGRDQGSLQNRAAPDRDDVQFDRPKAPPIGQFGTTARPNLATAEGISDYLAQNLLELEQAGVPIDHKMAKSLLYDAITKYEVDPVGQDQLARDQQAFQRRDEKLPGDDRQLRGPDGEMRFRMEERPAGQKGRGRVAVPTKGDGVQIFQRGITRDQEASGYGGRRVSFEETPRGAALAGRELRSDFNGRTPFQLLMDGIASGELTEDQIVTIDDDFTGKKKVRVGDVLDNLRKSQPALFNSDGSPRMDVGPAAGAAADRREGQAASRTADRRAQLRFTPEEIAAMDDDEFYRLQETVGLGGRPKDRNPKVTSGGGGVAVGQKLLMMNALAEGGDPRYADFKGGMNDEGTGIKWKNPAAVNAFLDQNTAGDASVARDASSMISQEDLAELRRMEAAQVEAAPVQGFSDPKTGLRERTGVNLVTNADFALQEQIDRRNVREGQARMIASRLMGEQGDALRAEQLRREGENILARSMSNFQVEDQTPFGNGSFTGQGNTFQATNPSAAQLEARGNILKGRPAQAGLQMFNVNNQADAIIQRPRTGNLSDFAEFQFRNPADINVSAEQFAAMSPQQQAQLLADRGEQPAGFRRQNATPMIDNVGKALGNFPIDLGNVAMRASQAQPAFPIYGSAYPASPSPNITVGFRDEAGNILGSPAATRTPQQGPLLPGESGVSPAADWIMKKMVSPFAGDPVNGGGFNEDFHMQSSAQYLKDPVDINRGFAALNSAFGDRVPLPQGGIKNVADLEQAVRIYGAQKPIRDPETGVSRPRNFQEVMDDVGMRGGADAVNAAQALFQKELAVARPETITGRARNGANTQGFVNNEADLYYLQNQNARRFVEGTSDVSLDSPFVSRSPLIEFDAAPERALDPAIGDVGRAQVPRGTKQGRQKDRKNRVNNFLRRLGVVKQDSDRLTPDVKKVVKALNEEIKGVEIAKAFRGLDPIARIEQEIQMLNPDDPQAGAKRFMLEDQKAGWLEAGWLGVKQAQSPLAGVEPGGDAGPRNPQFQRAPGVQSIFGPMAPNDPRIGILENAGKKPGAGVRLEGEKQPGPMNANRALQKEAELRGWAAGQGNAQPVTPFGGRQVGVGPTPLFGAPAPYAAEQQDGNFVRRHGVDNLGVRFAHQDDVPMGPSGAALGILEDGGRPAGGPQIAPDPLGDRVEREMIRAGGFGSPESREARQLPGGGSADISMDARRVAAGKNIKPAKDVTPIAREVERRTLGPADQTEWTEQVKLDMEPGDPFDPQQMRSISEKQAGQAARQDFVSPEAKMGQDLNSGAPSLSDTPPAQKQTRRNKIIKHLTKPKNRQRYGRGAAIAAGVGLGAVGIDSLINKEKDKREEEERTAAFAR